MKTATVMTFGDLHAIETPFTAGDGLSWRTLFRGTRFLQAPRSQRPTPEGSRSGSTVPVASVLDQTNDAICVCDLDGVIEYWNRAAEALYGWRADEAVGRVAHALFNTVFPAPLDRIEAELRRTGSWQGELVHTRRDGTRIAVASRWSLQRDEHATPVAVIATLTDITERKRLEVERSALEERLQQAEKLEAIGRFASGIAHDFNNILGAILGYGEIAKGKSNDRRVIDDELDQVMQAGQRGRRLIEQILAFSRSATAERNPVHVQSTVEETLRLVAASLPVGVRLNHELTAGDAAFLGDATQLHQVAMNLCTNAVHAMPRGGVLSVRLDRVAVATTRALAHGVLHPGDHLRLVVSDNGTGIPQMVKGRIFDPFFTTRTAKGAGLGLALVHGIVTGSRGAIELDSREGCGTTFTIWLPSCGDTDPPTIDDAPTLPNGHGESVLIVDDEAPLVRIAEEMLAGLGYEPAGFTSSKAALEAFRAEPDRYDLILTDATMPEVSGIELARAIRILRPDIPVMLMSGYRDAQLSAAAFAGGVTGILHKPLMSRDIAESIAQALAASPA